MMLVGDHCNSDTDNDNSDSEAPDDSFGHLNYDSTSRRESSGSDFTAFSSKGSATESKLQCISYETLKL